ncbi:MAG: type II toxin-antitoxin system RelE/ParE family toxin [Rhodospirillales bacterium]|nr:type II toxin-antitoxin system RelE/ParE family toxin [Rhodospirillales bacterium]
MKVRWTGKAEDDLTVQCDRVASEDTVLAGRIGGEVLMRVGGLADHPYRGRSGRVDGTRELPLPGLPWIAVYAVEEDTVVILRLLHGAQSWPPDEAG